MERVRAVTPYALLAIVLGGATYISYALNEWLYELCAIPLTFLAWHWWYRRGPPTVRAQRTAFNTAVLDGCPLVNGAESYYATPWLLNGHGHTLFASVLRKREHVAFEREVIQVGCGRASVAIDWIDDVAELAGRAGDGGPRSLPEDAPTILLLHGLTGGSTSPYVRHFMLHALSKGWRTVCFNFRGWGGSELTHPDPSHAADIGDVDAVVRHVSARRPSSPLVAVGWSIGANAIVKYLGNVGEDTPIRAAVSICNPWDILAVTYRIVKMYDVAVLMDLKKFVKEHKHHLQAHPDIDLSALEDAKTVREFDTLLTCRLLGVEDWEDFYASSSCVGDIAGVKVPLFAINSYDDPMVSHNVIPYALCRDNPNVILAVSRAGGHLGFAEGWAPWGPVWVDRVALQVLDKMLEVLDNGTSPSATGKSARTARPASRGRAQKKDAGAAAKGKSASRPRSSSRPAGQGGKGRRSKKE